MASQVNTINLPQNLIDEIASYKPIADRIIKEVIDGKFKGSTYSRLADFVDKFHNRMAGTQGLEDSIDFILDKSKEYGLDNVRAEEAPVHHWVRGKESATLILPHIQDLPMHGLGSSVGTAPEGIQAEVIVVNSFEEMETVKDKIKGKILVYNQEYTDYGATVLYRWKGASRASKYGAIATLIRSVTPFSLKTPHTGWNEYEEGTIKIPTAAITVEDAQMLRRRQERGEHLEILLKMEAQNYPPFISRNVMVDLKGSGSSNRVIVGGHIDSWDVGHGAMDDGAGCMLAWNSLLILKEMGLRPKRTIECVLWTGEEVDFGGANAHFEKYKSEMDKINFVLESDWGTWEPLGLDFCGTDYAAAIIKEILKLLAPINATGLKRSSPSVGADIEIWTRNGMPGAILWNKNEKYFWYHHTSADTIDIEDPHRLDLNTALWAVVLYVIADISVDIPKK